MKTQLGKSVADHIIKENQKLKSQLIFLRKDLKKFQGKMMEALDSLTHAFSSKLKDPKKLLLFQNPYECLNVFVQQITKSANFSISTSQQNAKLTSENKRLQRQMRKIEQQISQRKIKQEKIVEQLNIQIETKKQELQSLEQEYKQIVKSKKIAQRQLSDTKEQMKILRLKLYEEQRQKLTEIIVANKMEMIEFRKSMEMETYKQQLQFNREIAQKEYQIRVLTNNVEDLINSNLNATSDLTVLEKIVKPIRESTQMKDQIANLRKEVSDLKQQIRTKHSQILSLQGKNADISLSRDNLKSHNQRLDIEKKLLVTSLEQRTFELQKAVEDRKALDLYYGEKWHGQFSKVHSNLQEKFLKKTKILEQELQRKKKEVQSQIEAYIQRIRITKNEMNQLSKRNDQLLLINAQVGGMHQKLSKDNDQLHSVIREAQQFHTEELLVKTFQWQQTRKQLHFQIDSLSRTVRDSQSQLQKLISQFCIDKNNLIRQKFTQVQSLKKQHQKEKDQINRKHKEIIQGIQKHYSSAKDAIQAFRLAQVQKFQQKQKQLIDRQKEQVKEIQKISAMRQQKINQKLSQSEIRYQKLRKTKEEEQRQADRKLEQVQKLLHQNQLHLVAKDVELQEYRKMKDFFMLQINGLNKKLNEQMFRKSSLEVELQSAQNILAQKEKEITNFQSKSYKFKSDLQQFEKSYKKQFSELENTHRRIITQQKRRINELENLFEKRPIKPQHYQHIQSLEKMNNQLKTQIHLKEAENLILNQVKSYYENKAVQKYRKQPKEQDEEKQFLSTNAHFRTTNTFAHPAVKSNCQPMFVKKYSSRKNKLITTSSHQKIDASDNFYKESEPKDMTEMKRYLSKQHQVQNRSMSLKSRNNQRVKSSMM